MAGKVDLPSVPEEKRLLIEIKSNESYLPSVTCNTLQDKSTNDAVYLQSVEIGGKKALRFRFESEVGGYLGRRNPFTNLYGARTIEANWTKKYGEISPYEIYLTEDSELYAREVETGAIHTLTEQNDPEVFVRAHALVLAALGCYGTVTGSYSMKDLMLLGAKMLPNLTSPGESLPEKDRLTTFAPKRISPEQRTRHEREMEELRLGSPRLQ